MGVAAKLLKYGFYLYLLSSFKSVPGTYFVRFYRHVFKNIFIPLLFGEKGDSGEMHNIQLKLKGDKYGAMAQTKLSTYVSPMECDLYFHKNNATYFEELDISRCDLMTKIFHGLFATWGKPWPYIPVANVFTNYLKELRPFEAYNVYSSILCWDNKWIYVLSRFTKQNNKVLCSISITKYVLKEKRKTIQPKAALMECGLWNEDVEELSSKNYKILTEKCGFHETTPLEEMDFSKFLII